jgi:malate permease and related proteins
MNFSTTATAIASIFVLGFIGYLARRRALLSHTGIGELARLLVDFILPAMLFHATYTQFSPDKLPYLGLAGAAQFSFFTVGAALAYALHRLLRVRSHSGTIATMACMQNNVYLPIPIAMALLPPGERERGQFFIGCFVLFFTPVLWSVGVVMLSYQAERGRRNLAMLSNAINPAFLAIISGLLTKTLMLQLDWQMPALVLSVTKIAGDAMTPLAMVVLGGLLAEAKWTHDFEAKAVGIVVFVKLLCIPLLTVLVMRWHGSFDPVFAFILMLQSATPPATNISLVAKRFGGNTSLVALTLFVTYLISILTIPFWLSWL